MILYKNSFKESALEGDGVHTHTKPTNKNNDSIISWNGLSVKSDWYLLDKYAAPNMPIPGTDTLEAYSAELRKDTCSQNPSDNKS